MVIRKGNDAGRELDALRSFARGGEEHLGGADHLPPAGMMLAAPEFFVAELVQVLHEVEIAAELQHRVLTDRMVGGEEGTEVQTGHEQISWLVMMGDSTFRPDRDRIGRFRSPQHYHRWH